MTSTQNELLTREVCSLLEVTPSAVSRMVKRGALTPIRVVPVGRAGVFVFDRDQIEQLAAAKKKR